MFSCADFLSPDFISVLWILNPQIGAIATYYFSRAKCFHSQIFYPQISHLQILNPQIWAISTSRFSKIECFLMDLQTFEEEIFKHSKLFLSIIAVQKVRAVEHAEIKEGILL